MKYAVVRTGGKQYKVSEGDVLEIEKISPDKNDFIFDDVLLFASDDIAQIGSPILKGVTIRASVLEQKKGEKVRVAKFKAKVRYRKVMGHRQNLTRVKIDKILESAKSTEKDSKEEQKTVGKK